MPTTKPSTLNPTLAPRSATPSSSASPAAVTAEDKVWQALRQKPGATAAEIALAGGVGGSTARRVLTVLEKEGSAVRERGATPRAGDRWFVADEPGTATAAATAPHEVTGTTAPEPEPEEEQPETKASPAAAESAADVAEPPASPQESTVDSVGAGASVSAQPGVAEVASEAQQRLRPGALHGMIEDFLSEHPEAEFTAGEIGRKLSRSPGAVANALVRLAERGVATQSSASPKRYTRTIDEDVRNPAIAGT
ncbi:MULTISPECIES: hypothetical protein [unclassified Crossiella]|uniref:hypothetical protein n=1 Tax=unclassified Crossiella TaxID=2620835 RepID=UPI001FFFD83E|nr:MULTISPECIES: hypothetical protein [unclassified Crossiella]MCK2243681.1 hypothetical protein [Crossiella sp. S99.2]MCK2257540.1 hypothetical protein [Crossiella sp. S99.1]